MFLPKLSQIFYFWPLRTFRTNERNNFKAMIHFIPVVLKYFKLIVVHNLCLMFNVLNIYVIESTRHACAHYFRCNPSGDSLHGGS